MGKNRGFRGWARIRDEFIRAIHVAIHQNLRTLHKFAARIIHREVRQEREESMRPRSYVVCP
jgi:hypothetical protein